MKNALSITLGILLLAAVGFAATDSGEPVPAPDETVAPGIPASDNQITSERASQPTPGTPTTLPFARSTASPLDAKQCKTVGQSRSSDGLDECTECWLDCQREWRKCRVNCPPDDGSCVEACTDDLIWCQNVGCAPLCD